MPKKGGKKKKSKEELEAERVALEEEMARLHAEAATIQAAAEEEVATIVKQKTEDALSKRDATLDHLQAAWPAIHRQLQDEGTIMVKHAQQVASAMDEDYHMSCSLLPHPARSAELTQYLTAIQDSDADREALTYSLRKELNDLTALLRVSHRLAVLRAEQFEAGHMVQAMDTSQFMHSSHGCFRGRLDAMTAWMLEHAESFKKVMKDGREDPEVRISHQLGVRRWPSTPASSTSAAAPAANSAYAKAVLDGLLGTEGRGDRFLALAPAMGGGSVRFGLWLALKDRSRSLEVNHHAVGIKLKIPKAVTTMGVAVRAIHSDFDAAAATAEAAAEFEAALSASGLAADSLGGRPTSSMRPRSQDVRPQSSLAAGSTLGGGRPGSQGGGGLESKHDDGEDAAESKLDDGPSVSVAESAALSLSVAATDAEAAAAAIEAVMHAKPAERPTSRGRRSRSRSRSRSKKKKAAAEPEPTMEEKVAATALRHAEQYKAYKSAVADAHDFTGGAILPPLPPLPDVEDKNLWSPVGGVVAVELLERPTPGKFIRKWTLTPASALHRTVRRCPHPHEGKGETAQVHALRIQVTLRPSLLPPPELYIAYWDSDVMVPEAGGGYLGGGGHGAIPGVFGGVPGVTLPAATPPSMASLLPPSSGWVVDEDATPEIIEGNTLSFSTTWMRQQALVQPRYLDMPYRAWSVGPGSRAGSASVGGPASLVFSVTTQRLQLGIEVKSDSVALLGGTEGLPQQLQPLSGTAGHALGMGPGHFLLALRDAGVNLIADEECAAVLRGDFPGPKQNPPSKPAAAAVSLSATQDLGETAATSLGSTAPAASGAGGDVEPEAVEEEHGEGKEVDAPHSSLQSEGKGGEDGDEGGEDGDDEDDEGDADEMVSATEVVAYKHPAVECVAYRDMARLAAALQFASSGWGNSPRAAEDVATIPPPPGSTTAPQRAEPESLEHAQAERAGMAIVRARDATYAQLLPEAAGSEDGTSWRYLRYSYDQGAPEHAIVQLLNGATEAKLPGRSHTDAPTLQAEDALRSRMGPGTAKAIQQHSSVLAERLLRVLRLVRPLSFAVTNCDAEV